MTEPTAPEGDEPNKPAKPCPKFAVTAVEEGVFRLRWLLLPFMIGLAIALLVLGYEFVYDLIGLFSLSHKQDQTTEILNLLDKFMIATLLITTVLGSFHIYIRPIRSEIGWLPTWIEEMTSKELKIVTSLSLAGVTGIKLLEDFHQGVDNVVLMQHLAIHFTFILSPMAIALIWRWMHVTK